MEKENQKRKTGNIFIFDCVVSKIQEVIRKIRLEFIMALNRSRVIEHVISPENNIHIKCEIGI